MRNALSFALAAVALAAGPAAPAGAASLPDARHVLLGRSVEGREIRAVRVGDPDSPRKAPFVVELGGGGVSAKAARRHARAAALVAAG